MPWSGHPLARTIRSCSPAWCVAFALSLFLIAMADRSSKPAASMRGPAGTGGTSELTRRHHAALAADIDTCESAERRKKLVRTCIDQGALRRQWGDLSTRARPRGA
jgi:hypothetical protein